MSEIDWEQRAKQAEAEVADLQKTFDLRWNADMRAIKMWQEAGEGRELTWPDHADLCVWLLGQLDEKKGSEP